MKSTDWDFVIARRFAYWVYLPAEIQSKILSYFKFDVVYCLKFMRVSKSFKRHVELMHLDIYNISLGVCSKKCWFNKTWSLFTDMVRSFEMFTNVQTFDRNELKTVYTDGSIFRTFLHFFLCKRACDGVNDYCSICSYVRFRNFQNQILYDNVLLAERDFKSKLGLDDRIIDFDVFLSNYLRYSNEKICRRERIVQYAADAYILFVSTFIRVNLNSYYNFFLKLPLTINDEKYIVEKIQRFVRDLSNEIWELNVNHFFVVFDRFSELNRSMCYDVKFDKPLKGPYEPLVKTKQYYGQLIVVSSSNLRSSEYSSESES